MTPARATSPGPRRGRGRRTPLPLVAALALLASGCERAAATPWQARSLFHDFGMIPHGRAKTVRIRIDFPQDRGPMLPLGFRGSCSCAATRFIAVGKDGRERVSLGRASSEHAVLPGEDLFLELSLDTKRKEALEQKPLTNSGEVLLTDLAEKYGRVAIPISFTFGIEAPIALSPFAHIDFGALPLSRRFSVTLDLRPKVGQRVHFAEPKVTDSRVRAVLRSEGEATLLDVRVVPDRGLGVGSLHTVIEVPTDLPDGYTLPIPVSGQIVDDIEVKPMERVSFGRLDLAQPQEGSVIVRDHDLARPAEFVVLGIRGLVGKDLGSHFATELQPIAGDERSVRLVIRYLGTFRERTFRGFVDLGKRGGTGSVASIEFVGFGHE